MSLRIATVDNDYPERVQPSSEEASWRLVEHDDVPPRKLRPELRPHSRYRVQRDGSNGSWSTYPSSAINVVRRESLSPVMTPSRGGECRHAWPTRGKWRLVEKKIRRHGSFKEPPVVEMIRDVRILIVTSLTYWILFNVSERKWKVRKS